MTRSDTDNLDGRTAAPTTIDPPPGVSRAPGYVLRRLYQSYQSVWMKHVDGIATGPQAAVLMAVRDNPGVEQGALGASVALDRSTMASIVSRLVERNWLTRTTPPQDGRKRLLELTDEGSKAIDEILERSQALERILLDGYGPRGRDLIVDMWSSLADEWEALAQSDG